MGLECVDKQAIRLDDKHPMAESTIAANQLVVVGEYKGEATARPYNPATDKFSNGIAIVGAQPGQPVRVASHGTLKVLLEYVALVWQREWVMR